MAWALQLALPQPQKEPLLRSSCIAIERETGIALCSLDPLLAAPLHRLLRLRGAHMAHADRRRTPSPSDRVRDVRRAGPEAQASPLRGLHAKGSAASTASARSKAARNAMFSQCRPSQAMTLAGAARCRKPECGWRNDLAGHRRNRGWAREHPAQRDEASGSSARLPREARCLRAAQARSARLRALASRRCSAHPRRGKRCRAGTGKPLPGALVKA